jgi:hypothetical protein
MVRNILISVKNSICSSGPSFGERLRVGYICLGLVFLLISCSNSEFEYSNNSCYFVFDNAQHNDPTLTSALIATSPGTFCRIYTKAGKKFKTSIEEFGFGQ